MPRNSTEYNSRRAEDDESTEHQQENTSWAKEDHAYDVLRHIFDRDRETAMELVNIRSRVAHNDYPAVSWMDQNGYGGNEARKQIWEAYQQTKEYHDPEQNEYAANELAHTLTHRAERTVRDFIDPELNQPWSHNDRLDSAVKEAVKHQTMMHPWGVEETRLMEHLQEEIAKGLQDGNKARFEDAMIQTHELEETWQSVKGETWDAAQKEHLEAGYAFLNRLAEKNPDLLRELDRIATQNKDGQEASWLREERSESIKSIVDAFREATETLPIEKTYDIAKELASTMEYPVWKEIRELANHHPAASQFNGNEHLSTIPDQEGFKEMTVLAAEDLYYGLKDYKDDLVEALAAYSFNGSRAEVANIVGLQKEAYNVQSGWKPDHFFIPDNGRKYDELEFQRKESLAKEYNLYLGNPGTKNSEALEEPVFADFAKNLLESDIMRMASMAGGIAANNAGMIGITDTKAVEEKTKDGLFHAAMKEKKAQRDTE